MIIFPMAGKSSRFFLAGYDVPKYMLPLAGKTVFELAVLSFEEYFHTQKFVFILGDDTLESKIFLEERITRLGIRDHQTVVLSTQTRGQAETVFLGLEKADTNISESITIFNIDTFRPGFKFPEFLSINPCSYLETFIGTGQNWSNVIPVEAGSNLVLRALEKQQASEFCCTGLYHWQSLQCFNLAYLKYLKVFPDKELYVAPMYNFAIEMKYVVRFNIVPPESVIFCGTPSEYEEIRSKDLK